MLVLLRCNLEAIPTRESSKSSTTCKTSTSRLCEMPGTVVPQDPPVRFPAWTGLVGRSALVPRCQAGRRAPRGHLTRNSSHCNRLPRVLLIKLAALAAGARRQPTMEEHRSFLLEEKLRLTACPAAAVASPSAEIPF